MDCQRIYIARLGERLSSTIIIIIILQCVHQHFAEGFGIEEVRFIPNIDEKQNEGAKKNAL